MKQQHKRSFCAAAAMVLCLCMALGVMGMGLAKWQTTLTASGGVSAAGKWDLAVTDASIKTSSGAAVSLPFSGSPCPRESKGGLGDCGPSDRRLHLARRRQRRRYPVGQKAREL